MRGTAWTVSYFGLWVLVMILALAVVVLLRQIGVLHSRLAPMGTHFGGEGPELDGPAPAVAGVAFDRAPLTLLSFSSPTCVLCRELRPSIEALRRQYREVQIESLELSNAADADFAAYNVRSTPYFVTVDRSGSVRGRGVANSLEQIEELIREALLDGAR